MRGGEKKHKMGHTHYDSILLSSSEAKAYGMKSSMTLSIQVKYVAILPVQDRTSFR